MPTLPTKDTKPSPCSKTLYAGIKLSNQRVPKKKKKNPHKKGKRWGGWKREWGQAPDRRNSDTGEQTPGSINKEQKRTQQQYNSPSPAFTSKLVLWRSYDNGIKKTPWTISDHYLRMLQF